MYLYTKICIYIYTLITLYIERDSLLKPPSPAQFCQLLAAELDWLVLSRCISELFVNINTYTWYPPRPMFSMGFAVSRPFPLKSGLVFLKSGLIFLKSGLIFLKSGESILADPRSKMSWGSWPRNLGSVDPRSRFPGAKTAQESWIRGSKTQLFSRRVARSWILDPGLLDPRLPKRSLWASWILDHGSGSKKSFLEILDLGFKHYHPDVSSLNASQT